MKRFMKLFTLGMLCLPATSFADITHYKDNKGILYCELKCDVDDTEYKVGLYPENSDKSLMTVRGRWVPEGISVSASGKYLVGQNKLEAAIRRCEDIREKLIGMEPIRGLMESKDLSDVNEDTCKIYPKITSGVGLLSFDMVAETKAEFEL